MSMFATVLMVATLANVFVVTMLVTIWVAMLVTLLALTMVWEASSHR